jgi:hypothetical protein
MKRVAMALAVGVAAFGMLAGTSADAQFYKGKRVTMLIN